MKFKHIGFGGFGDYPVYEDEKGFLYFDINYGKGKLDLHTGAFRERPDDNMEINGEPNRRFKGTVECDNPYKENPRSFDYQMLGRYQSDCDYFLGYGNGYEGHLYYHSVEKQIEKMKELWNSFAENEKPQWLTMEQIEKYEKDMLELRKERN